MKHAESHEYSGKDKAFQKKMMERAEKVYPKLTDDEINEAGTLFEKLEKSGIVEKMINDLFDFLLEKDTKKKADDSDNKLRNGMDYFIKKMDQMFNDLYQHDFFKTVLKREKNSNPTK